MSRRRSSVHPVERVDDGIARVDDAAFRRLSQAHPDIGLQAEQAKKANDMEKSLTVKQAVKLYKKAILYSVFLSLAVVMEGYDLNVTGSFMGYNAFQRRFGTEVDASGQPRISPAWQAGVLNGTSAGQIIGLWLNGYLSEWLGYKKTVLLALVASALFNFIHFFAQSIGMVVAGSVLMGLPWGIYQTLTLSYASDITPAVIRPYLTTYVNICWVMGQLVAVGVLRGCESLDNDWGWRIPFAVQWIWVPIIATGAILAPESPWWLVRKGRLDQARNSILKLTTPWEGVAFDVDSSLILIKHTNELEQAINQGVGYMDTVRPIERRRTLIASVVWLTQAWCGAALMGYSVQIFQEAGLAQIDALNLALGQYSLGIVGTVIAWFSMSYIGRRKLYTWGLVVLFGLLMIIGGLGTISENNSGAAWALGAILLVYTFAYNCTVGPVCYAIISEMPSTRVKIKTVVIARNVYNIGGILNNILVPRMLSPNDWNWAGRTGFFYAGLTGVLAVFMYFMLPESKGRTYAEMDVLFENKVSARKFHKTSVDQFAGQHSEMKYDPTGRDSSESTTAGSEGEKASVVNKESV